MKQKITKKEARQLALLSQFNFDPPQSSTPAQGTSDVIARLGYIQIDTISVIQRAHHHVLHSRLPQYHPSHLHQLQQEPRKVFEYWSHAAAYLPIQHYRFALPRMRRCKNGGFTWFPRDKKVMKYVKDRIKAEGPLEAKDFKEPVHKSAPWWGWKPAKIALEHLFMEGTLTVVQRVGFRKQYDLAQRVLPPETDTKMPTPTQSAQHLIAIALQAGGLASVKDITYGRKDHIEKVPTVMARKVKSGELLEVALEGVKEPYYTTPCALERLEEWREGDMQPQVRFLSPFDNVVINRKRLLEIFDFEYRLECYVPAPKRVLGYFSLPVLYGDTFIGILDAKADRKSKRFIIRNLHLDRLPTAGFRIDQFRQLFHHALSSFMAFNQSQDLEVEKVYPQNLKADLFG